MKIIGLNVCGLHSKLELGILTEMIKDVDFACLSETKTDDVDMDFIPPGFKVFHKVKTNSKFRHGGVHGLCLIAKDIYNIHVLEDIHSHYILWTKVEFKCNFKFILGSVYVPHESSKYHDPELFEEIACAIVDVKRKFDLPICLVGDFNSRTGNLADFIEDEEFSRNKTEYNDEDGDDNFRCTLPVRCNTDTSVNKNGTNLLELCKTSDLCIVNGRIGDDVFGKCTFADSSTIDYCLISRESFELVENFQVDNFDNTISDKHNVIRVYLNTCTTFKNEEEDGNITCTFNEDHSETVRIVWDNSLCGQFSRKFDEDAISEISCKIDSLHSELSQSSMDCLFDSIKAVYIDAAAQVNILKKTNRNVKGHCKPRISNNKPWFDDNCRKLRLQYLKLKNKNKSHQSRELKIELENMKRSYKKALKNAQNRYFKDIHTSLRALKTTNPKEYWNVLNPSGKKKSEKCLIDIGLFHDHFKSLNDKPDSSENDNIVNQNNVSTEAGEFDTPISEEEVISQIKRMKNNKSPGVDLIVNECLKNSSDSLIKMITKLFSLVFETGIIPTEWTIGIIRPIYKKKGSINDPDNYRGITLLSCIGKLFTSIINERLNKYLNDNNLIGEEQAGFRENYSTTDHIFVLHSILDLYLSQNKRIYCAFIDYKKAFDSIDRTSLWQKLFQNGVRGKVFRVIRNMYANLKSCVMNNNETSKFFKCNIGVRQGENLSPILFALYLNDFQTFIKGNFNGVDLLPLNMKNIMFDKGVDVFLVLFTLLYADDTLILANNENELQLALNAVSDYCKLWLLQVNSSKTKVVIFSKGKVRKHKSFKFNDNDLEVVDDYTYLGVVFNYNNKFKKAQINQICKAKRAMYSLMIKAKKLRLPVDIQLDLFDRLVVPILIYGCEVWGFENLKQIEIVHTQYCRYLLKVRKNTMNCMTLGELGRLDMTCIVKERMLNFWLRTINGKEFKISTIVCNVLKLLSDHGVYSSPWLKYIHTTLQELGLSHVWQDFAFLSRSWFKPAIKLRLSDAYLQSWQSKINDSTQCTNYRIFKTKMCLDDYLLKLPISYKIILTKFRCGNHRLPIVTGRFNGIDRQNRICQLCNLNKIGDEFHYLFECPNIETSRKKYLKKYYRSRPNTLKMYQLFNSNSPKELLNLSKFAQEIMNLHSV